MIEQLRNPKPGYEETIRTHFKLQKERIKKIVSGWKTSFNLSSNLYDELVIELDKLED